MGKTANGQMRLFGRRSSLANAALWQTRLQGQHPYTGTIFVRRNIFILADPRRIAHRMKLHLNIADGLNNISAHGPGFVIINQQRHEAAVVVMPDRLIAPWEIGDAAALAPADFEAVLQLKPELVVFGSGAMFRFPDPRIMAMFAKAKTGFDVMDTPAACRTYNVLMNEGRNVAAALLIA